MSTQQPPRIAIRLLETFGASQALIGDLIERYARGRSRLWFWRQALAAIAISAVKDVRDHPLLFARAVVVGFVAMFVLTRLRYGVIFLTGPKINTLEFRFLGCVIYFVASWLIGRLHRPYGPSMVLAALVLVWLLSAPSTLHQIENVFQHARYRPYVSTWLIDRLLYSACALVGGIFSAGVADRERYRRHHPST